MRRVLGCLFTLLLAGALLLILIVRGPGLQSLPIPASLDPLADTLTRVLGAGVTATPMPPLARITPSALPPATVEPPPTATPGPANIVLELSAQGPAGKPLNVIIDGNGIRLLAQVLNTTQERVTGVVSFTLGSPDAGGIPLGSCQIDAAPGGRGSCVVPLTADGWAWQDHLPARRRDVHAMLAEPPASATLEVLVQPKPVVLVHGFTSNAAAWSAWTGPEGFLATWGIPGYAVGDGQFDIEPMDTGDFTQPRRPTKSIEENAELLARYVAAVRQATGAERVDLVGHSMGGLISRYYISHLMPLVERQGLPTVPAVNQLYMIGTPNAGTTCAVPPATLGLYPPATTQLTPSYIQYLFNPQTRDHRGVPFFVLAGDPVQDFAALVCTPVPTDVFVSVGSAAGAIPVAAQTMPVRHGEQNKSPAVFATVLKSLSRGPGEYPIPMPTAPAIAPADTAGLQVALVDSGTLSGDRPAMLNVTVDEAEAASFLLYAPGQAVEMSILTSAGQSITQESAQTAPDVSTATTDDKVTIATQGFQISQPKAGEWQLILRPRADAKSRDGFYAVAAFVWSDLRLAVETASPTVEVGESVPIRAILSGPAAYGTVVATATIRDARGKTVAEEVLLDDGAHAGGKASEGIYGGTWVAEEAGLYTIVVTASGQNMAGSAFQRVGILAVEVQ